ncbi:hypothetical protein OS175_10705 [Marinicella sp. S1101]|uniref:hypothetical protein n=1 Tax=Marinicella marina TaxID=2996016 RepID=UPI002260A1F6|nr:hypothetical protein [Marinicella marina]MCX7554351.1 hypothetical protein [Marinicella marina]MDJ1138658.1 hypothetical protein [Marinicella marina]
MKKIMTVMMLLVSLGLMAQEQGEKNANLFEFEIGQVEYAIDMNQLLAFPNPMDPPIDPPRCLGNLPLCNLVLTLWEMGRTDIPAGCHRSGAVGSEVVYCEIK